jgi:hypothetical protein
LPKLKPFSHFGHARLLITDVLHVVDMQIHDMQIHEYLGRNSVENPWWSAGEKVVA